MQEQFFLSFAPAQPCQEQECERLTAIGIADHRDGKNLYVEPVCFEHGYYDVTSEPSEEDLSNQRASLVRFVIGVHGEKGTADILGACPLDSVPAPYEQEPEPGPDADKEEQAFWRRQHIDDRAWYATWTGEQGQVERGVVVWSPDYLELEWYPFPF